MKSIFAKLLILIASMVLIGGCTVHHVHHGKKQNTATKPQKAKEPKKVKNRKAKPVNEDTRKANPSPVGSEPSNNSQGHTPPPPPGM